MEERLEKESLRNDGIIKAFRNNTFLTWHIVLTLGNVRLNFLRESF